jgi:phosphoheptose isomerase
MEFARKIVLHSTKGYRPELDELIEKFKANGVIFVGVVGVDASRMEDIIDELCVGNGTGTPYEMLTSAHEGESVEEAMNFANQLTGEFSGESQLVEF